jgi:hypothetical protein
VPLKSIEHHNTGTWPEEVEEEPMVTMRAQEQQRQVTVKAKRKSGASSFFSTLLFCECQYEAMKKDAQNKHQNTRTVALFFFFSFFLFSFRLDHSRARTRVELMELTRQANEHRAEL